MKRSIWQRRRVLGLLVGLVLLLAFVPAGHRHVRAATLLMRLSDAAFDTSPAVREEPFELDSPRGTVPARLYAPVDDRDAPAIVLVHGVHDKGISEPRLRRFARAVAASGVVVLTPEIRELTDYRIQSSSIDTVVLAVNALTYQPVRCTVGAPRRGGWNKVGLMGLSFGGGLALLAASRPEIADHVSFVVAVGAHDNLERVTTFFVTGAINGPDGTPSGVKPHDYGAMVLAYSHARDLFPEEDREIAEAAMALWLHEDQKAAREKAKLLPEPSRARIETLFLGHFSALRADLLRVIALRKKEMEDVSPSGHLATLHAPVYLLHGAGDTVIPATETRWLARDVPQIWLREALVSSAIVHVDMGGETPLFDRWQLVEFMAHVLDDANAR